MELTYNSKKIRGNGRDMITGTSTVRDEDMIHLYVCVDEGYRAAVGDDTALRSSSGKP